jgi:tellurite resistance protein
MTKKRELMVLFNELKSSPDEFIRALSVATELLKNEGNSSPSEFEVREKIRDLIALGEKF